MKRQKFILPVILILILAGLNSCYLDGRHIKGQGPVVEQSFDMPDISAVALSIDANVVITKADTQMVTIQGQQNIINNIEKHVTNDGLWRIGYYNPVRSHAGITVRITTPHFNYATVSGSGNIQSNDLFADSTNVYLKISGSGGITMNTVANIVQSEISGSGKIYLYGSANEHSIDISGSGDVRAFGLDTQSTNVKISGSGSSEVTVWNLLDVTISGSGNVYYRGNPEIHAQISGSGRIINSNN